MESTDIFLKRYHNHIQTPGFGVPGQDSLTNARVLITGTSAVALQVLSYLSSMGVGTIGLLSSGIVEMSELPSSPLFAGSSLGKPKGQTAVRQAREINPQIKLDLIEAGAAVDMESLVDNYDLIVDSEKDINRTLLLDSISSKTGKPLIWASLNHPTAFIRVLNYKGSGSYRSMLSDEKIRQLIDAETAPGLSTLAAVAGSLVANEVVKIIAEIGDIASNRLLAFNTFENRLDVFTYEPKEENNITGNGFLGAGYGKQKQSDSSYWAITPQQLQTKINYKEPLQLVDIRPQVNEDLNDWNYLHIPEAELPEKYNELHQDITVILLSEDGESAERLCIKLNEKLGFDNIFYLKGGFAGWKREMNTSEIKYESF